MRSLSVIEGMLFERLQSGLSEDWVVSFKATQDIEWVALIYQETYCTTMPRFTVCRWREYIGLFVRWMDGTSSTFIHTDLCSVLDMISHIAFEMAGAHLATVPMQGWADIKH